MNRLLALKPMVVTMAVVLVTGCALVLPEKLTQQEVRNQVAGDMSNLTRGQELVTGQISLYEAMARALKYNLDFRLQLLEQSLSIEELNLARYDMLPRFIVDIGYNARDKFSGASSQALENGFGPGGVITTRKGTQSLVASTSSNRDVLDAELGISWNILDFGLSYVRAKQAADRVLIAEEQKRRVVNRIVQDVRTAYWRAVTAERLKGQMHSLSSRVAEALSDSRQVLDRRLDSPMNQLTYQRELLSIKRELEELQRDLTLAKVQLAALMNLRPNEPYQLAVPERGGVVRDIRLGHGEMEQLALEWRPELRELAYEARINAKEVKAAVLDLMPGFELSFSKHFSSNSFLFNNNWINLGSQVAWNAMELVRLPQRLKLVEAQGSVIDAQRLALSMAVLTQVNVTLAQYAHANNEYSTASAYYDTQRDIMDQVSSGASVNRISEQALIREAMNTLVAEVRYDIAYADLENAFAGVYAAIGLDPLPPVVDAVDIPSLTDTLREHWEGL